MSLKPTGLLIGYWERSSTLRISSSLQSAPVFNLTGTLASFGLPRLSTLFGSPAPGLADNIFESRSTFDETQIAIFGEASWDITQKWRVIAGFRWFDFDQDFFFGDTQGAFASGLSINNNLSEDGINPKFSLEFRPNEDWVGLWHCGQRFPPRRQQ